jgi:hypothetical protein
MHTHHRRRHRHTPPPTPFLHTTLPRLLLVGACSVCQVLFLRGVPLDALEFEVEQLFAGLLQAPPKVLVLHGKGQALVQLPSKAAAGVGGLTPTWEGGGGGGRGGCRSDHPPTPLSKTPPPPLPSPTHTQSAR